MHNPESAYPLGFSFINSSDDEWRFIIDEKLESSPGMVTAYQNLKEALTTSPASDIRKPDDYITYLGNHFALQDLQGIPKPHKAWIQLKMAKLGINEAATRIVPCSDIPSSLHYGLSLLASGHKNIWLGTGDIDDFSDPQGLQNINPPLYKNIRNLEGLLLNLACAIDFGKEHPHSYLKIFPQDREKPSLCSLVVAESKGDKNWFHLKIRDNEYTTSERDGVVDDPLAISIDYSNHPIRIYTNKSTKKTMHWLEIIFRSHDLFKKLDSLHLKGSSYINPEFMVYRNGKATKISFFTDVIWGSKKANILSCPHIAPAIKQINRAISQGQVYIIPSTQIDVFESKNNFLHAVLNTISSARSPNPDRQSATMLLKMYNSKKSRLPYDIPILPFRIKKALERISRGSHPEVISELIYELENTLQI